MRREVDVILHHCADSRDCLSRREVLQAGKLSHWGHAPCPPAVFTYARAKDLGCHVHNGFHNMWWKGSWISTIPTLTWVASRDRNVTWVAAPTWPELQPTAWKRCLAPSQFSILVDTLDTLTAHLLIQKQEEACRKCHKSHAKDNCTQLCDYIHNYYSLPPSLSL